MSKRILNDIEGALRRLSDFDIIIKIEVVGHADHDLVVDITVDDILWDDHIFSDAALESLEAALVVLRDALQDYAL